MPVVLTPGGGGGKGGLRWLAQRLRGTRQCLIWDRPNCGASGLTLGDTLLQPEPDLQVRVLGVALATRRQLTPRVAGGLPAPAAAQLGHGARYSSGQAQRRSRNGGASLTTPVLPHAQGSPMARGCRSSWCARVDAARRGALSTPAGQADAQRRRRRLPSTQRTSRRSYCSMSRTARRQPSGCRTSATSLHWTLVPRGAWRRLRRCHGTRSCARRTPTTGPGWKLWTPLGS